MNPFPIFAREFVVFGEEKGAEPNRRRFWFVPCWQREVARPLRPMGFAGLLERYSTAG